MKELYQAISNAQSEIGVLTKDLKNKHFGSSYYDINQVIKNISLPLQKNGLVLIQPIKENKVYSIIMHVETGQSIESYLEMPVVTNPQVAGSVITYYRRYTLTSLLGLEAEDDDGNKGAENEDKEQGKDKEPETWLNITDKEKNFTREWQNVVQGILDGKIKSVSDVRKHYKVSKEVSEKIEEQLKNKNK